MRTQLQRVTSVAVFAACAALYGSCQPGVSDSPPRTREREVGVKRSALFPMGGTPGGGAGAAAVSGMGSSGTGAGAAGTAGVGAAGAAGASGTAGTGGAGGTGGTGGTGGGGGDTAPKTIPDLVKCLNEKAKTKPPADVVALCIPSGCKYRLINPVSITKKENSAQPGCEFPKDADADKKCVLPRVILECDGGKFQPSFSLCPSSDSQRIEVCQGDGPTTMADIAIPKGGYVELPLKDAVSTPEKDGDKVTGDSKGCSACHTKGDFGETDVGGIKGVLLPKFPIQEGTESTQTIDDVCKCIKDRLKDKLTPDYDYLLPLCEALAAKQKK